MSLASVRPGGAAASTPRGDSVYLGDTAAPLSELTAGSLLRRVAAQRPDVVALEGISDDGTAVRRWTYAELLAESLRVATGIRERVPLGARVALWAPSVPEWVVFEYAAALAGVTLVTLNPALRAGGLAHALRTSEAEMLVHADRSRTYDMAAVARAVVLTMPSVRHSVSMADWETLQGDGPAPSDREIASGAVPAQIQFTSGTTGEPKAVLLSHQAVVNVARLTFELLGVRDGATVVSPLPMFHTAGCVISCLGPLWSGGTFVLLERFDPALLLEVLGRSPNAVLTSVPTVLAALNDAARSMARPPRLSAVLTGAAPVRAQLIRDTEDLFSTTVFNLYGQTETASVLTLTRPDDTAECKTSTVGRPLPHVECKIVDPDTGQVLPLETQGEICARGYQQMLAYHGDPEATAKKVDAEGWLHTGDIGSMDAAGVVRLDGRLSDIIIRGGENIGPSEIEKLLTSLAGVRESVVVGVPDDMWGEVVAAVLQPVPGQSLDLDAALARCRAELTPRDIPVQWYRTEEFPLTASGKIQRFRVRDLLLEGGFKRLDVDLPARRPV